MLHLAKDGIFPITKDKDGKLLKELPASGLHVPGTIQGEGKLNGIPSLFIRLAGCNLHCTWKTLAGNTCECDTAYAAFKVENSFSLPIREIVQIIDHNRGNIDHIVITGGEPFLQADKVRELCMQLKKEPHFHMTVETNATIYVEECAGMIFHPNYPALFLPLLTRTTTTIPVLTSRPYNHLSRTHAKTKKTFN